MSIWIAGTVWCAVHVFSLYVLRASNTWNVLFAPVPRLAERTPDPLAASPRGWIENHEFWDLDHQAPADDDEFWGRAVDRSVS